MPLNFPSSPTNGQQYTDDNAVVWEYDGVKWNVIRGTANKTYSGVRVGFTSDYNITSTIAAVEFDNEIYDTDLYFTNTFPSKVSVNRSGFYRINFSVYTSADGASYTITLKKNGVTDLASVILAPNQYSNYDEILELSGGDYLEIYASDSQSTGALTTNSFIEITRLGFSMGTFVSSADAFSGVRTKLNASYSTTSNANAVSWSTTVFDQNANPAGETYWSSNNASRVSVKLSAYYRVKSVITVGSVDTYTIALKKNGSTTLSSVTVDPNGNAQFDEIYNLLANDYLEIFANDAESTGSLTTATYLELTRVGV